MSSPLLALFNRSLRQDARAKSTYWARAGLVSLMCMMMYTTHASMGWAGAPGLRFFSTLIYTNLSFISLAGLSFFSSAITEEKEEMTLGLLQMTNLNPLSILLGKSTSRLFGGVLLVAVQLPFTLLAISFGGVGFMQIIAAYCALMAYVIFLSNLALLASVIHARTTGAAILTGALLIAFLFGHYFTLGALYCFYKWGIIAASAPSPALRAILEIWESLSPITRFNEVLSTGFNEGPVCPQVYGSLALGALCFGLAWASFDFFCRDLKDAAPRRWLFFKAGPKKVRAGKMLSIFSPGRPWKHALIWKEYYFLTGGKIATLGRLAIYGILPWTLLTISDNSSSDRLEQYGYTYIFSMIAAIAAELVVIAGRVFRQERRWQTLSSLAMLPVSTRRLAYQKVLGCLLGCGPAVFYFLFGWVLLIIAQWDDITAWLHGPPSKTLVNGLSSYDWYSILAFVSAVAFVLFFLHLVADLSLRFKWGAIPLAIAITWVLGMIVLPMFFLTMGQASLVALPAGMLGATGFLHARIGQRLEQLAAEE